MQPRRQWCPKAKGVTVSLETFAGVKVASVIAGLIGGVVSLAYVPGLTPGKAFLAVVAGASSAGYLTPIVVNYLGLSAEQGHGVAFLLGLMALNVLAGFFRIGERFREKPGEILENLRRGK